MSVLLDQATGITCHSADVRPGNIFVAIRGWNNDGNRYAAEAVAKGALAVVTDAPDHLPPLSVPVVVTPDARKSLAQLAAGIYRHPSKDLSLVGVTGSNGKTTITFMLEHIYKHAGLSSGLIGTVRVDTGCCSFPSVLTTPDAAKIQYYLSEMRHNGVTHAAMEVSAQGIEMHRVDGVQFSYGVLTNICPDHLDFHGDFHSYLSAKKRFLKLLGSDTPLVVNAADPYCREIINGYCGPVITAAINHPADATADIIHMTACTSKFMLKADNHQLTVSLPLPGKHNIENALLAAVVALQQGIPPQAIAAALKCFKAVERRMKVTRLGELTVIDDTALNPGSIDAVFSAIQNFRYRRLVVVNAVRGRRGPAINAANAATIGCWQKVLPFTLIVTAGAGAVSFADTVLPEELTAFMTQLCLAKRNYIYAESLSQAIRTAVEKTAPGDLLVLLGAQGMDDGYQELSRQLTTTQQLYDAKALLPAVTW